MGDPVAEAIALERERWEADQALVLEQLERVHDLALEKLASDQQDARAAALQKASIAEAAERNARLEASTRAVELAVKTDEHRAALAAVDLAATEQIQALTARAAQWEEKFRRVVVERNDLAAQLADVVREKQSLAEHVAALEAAAEEIP